MLRKHAITAVVSAAALTLSPAPAQADTAPTLDITSAPLAVRLNTTSPRFAVSVSTPVNGYGSGYQLCHAATAELVSSDGFTTLDSHYVWPTNEPTCTETFTFTVSYPFDGFGLHRIRLTDTTTAQTVSAPVILQAVTRTGITATRKGTKVTLEASVYRYRSGGWERLNRTVTVQRWNGKAWVPLTRFTTAKRPTLTLPRRATLRAVFSGSATNGSPSLPQTEIGSVSGAVTR